MLPKNVKAGIDRYVDFGCPTGSFLYAVLTNDLFKATERADHLNRLVLVEICEYIYNFTPNVCYGTTDKVAAWLKFHKTEPSKANEAAAGDRGKREVYYDTH